MSRFIGDKFGSRRFNGEISFTKQRTVRLVVPFKTLNGFYFRESTPLHGLNLFLQYL